MELINLFSVMGDATAAILLLLLVMLGLGGYLAVQMPGCGDASPGCKKP
jgi:hypothetical protein